MLYHGIVLVLPGTDTSLINIYKLQMSRDPLKGKSMFKGR